MNIRLILAVVFFLVLPPMVAVWIVPNSRAEDAQAYAVALVSVKNESKMTEYLSKALPLFRLHKAEVIAQGDVEKILAGQLNSKSIAVAKFPNAKAIDEFYNSKAYQEIIPLRDEAADVVFFTIN